MNGMTLDDMVKKLWNVVFGNEKQKGLNTIVAVQGTWLKVIFIMCGAILTLLVPMFLKVIFGG